MIENIIEDITSYLTDNLFTLTIIAFNIVFFIFILRYYFLHYWSFDRERKELFSYIEDRLEMEKPPKKPFEKAIVAKRERILNISNIAYHYLNRKAIKSYYYQYFQKPIVTNIETEVSHQNAGELKGTVPRIIEGKSTMIDASKEKTKMKIPELSEEEMFLIYQREVVLRKQVIIDLEILDIDLTELNQFNEKIIELDKEYGLKIPDDILSVTQTNLKTKATEKMKKRLENVTGWVLVEGNFEIKDSKKYYEIKYLHPISII